MIRFFDSTGIVKAFVPKENGHDQARNLLSEPRGHGLTYATAAICVIESYSKLWRLTRSKREVEKLEDQLKKFDVYDIIDDISRVKTMITKHGLKGADSAILSAAIFLHQTSREVVQLVSSDKDLLKAASSEKLRIIPLPMGLR